jgi:probable F420-dependent oxidoreductase
MKYSLRLQPEHVASPEAISRVSRWAEDLGFGAIWSSEASFDPFLPLGLVAAATQRVQIGTGIAVAYARSPYSAAQMAWMLQRLSGGRFRLGLATQVKAHIERRYGLAWPGGVGALREYIAMCRAVWRCWQTGEKPAFEGKHYRFTLMNPEFAAGRLPEGQDAIPVWVAAVGTLSGELAGEAAEGLHVHAFHTEGYLRDVLLPAVAKGREKAGRPPGIEAACPVFSGIAHDETQARVLRDVMRKHIAFYASTPAYLPVLEQAGCATIHAPLRQMSRDGRWAEMPALVDDTILDRFVVIDGPRRLGERLAAKYEGILTEIAVYREGAQFAREEDWPELLDGLRNPRR